MKHIGIIAEYNPFHNGHFYQINRIKEIFPNKKIIVMMSGNYVQRGEPALFSKFIRTRSALIGGADIVFELPILFASSSSEQFASAGVLALAKTGIIDTLCFGAEDDNLNILSAISDIFINEPENYKQELKKNLSAGLSFPKSRANALEKCFPSRGYSDIINKPNNILAIEYISAIKKYNLPISPYIIKRIGNDHNTIDIDNYYSSATSLRNAVRSIACANKIDHKDNSLNIHADHSGNQYDLNIIKTKVPEDVFSYLSSEPFAKPIYYDDYLPFIQYELISDSHNLESYYEITDYLANTIKNISCYPNNIDDLVDSLSGRHITKSRIRRCLLNIVLKKSNEFMKNTNNDFVNYLQLLGFRSPASSLIRKIQDTTDIPIITKAASAKKQLNENAKIIFNHQIFIDNLYRQVFYDKYGITITSDYEQSVIIEN